MRFLELVVLGASLLVFGCATMYRPLAGGSGYSETRLAENVFRVSFSGNAYTAKHTVSDFALLRCAEVALQNGFTCFAVLESDQDATAATYTTPSTSYTTGSAYAGGYGTAYGTSRTTTYGGGTHTILAPRVTNTIVCFREKPERVAFEANYVRSSIRAKYSLGER